MRIASAVITRGASAEVEARRTPASMTEIRAALAQAVQAVTGRPAHPQTLDLLSAQVSLETAHGSAMYNFNFGGIKGASPSGESAQYLTHEVVGGKQLTLEQGFRAYHSLADGARDYVQLLQSRFPSALQNAAIGDVAGFAHSLHEAHYYTASEADYAAGLRGAMGAHDAHAAKGAVAAAANGGSDGFSTTTELARVLDAIAASSSRIAAPDGDS